MILLTLVLAYVGYKTISKGVSIYKEESAGNVKSTFIENVNRDDSNENTHSYDPLIIEVSFLFDDKMMTFSNDLEIHNYKKSIKTKEHIALSTN